jgi:hypothetical protein
MSASKPPERRTREAQYQPIADDVRSAGEERLGIQSSRWLSYVPGWLGLVR